MPAPTASLRPGVPELNRFAGEAPLSIFLERWCGLAALAGGVLWLAAWLLSTRTFGYDQRFLGLSEGQYRALLNPALLLLLFALGGFYQHGRGCHARLSRLGFLLAAAGLLGLLIGNLLEYGLLGALFLAEIGWPLAVLSTMPLGLGLIAIGAAPAVSPAAPASLSFWVARLPVLMGLSTLLTLLLSWPDGIIFGMGLGCMALGLALESSKRL